MSSTNTDLSPFDGHVAGGHLDAVDLDRGFPFVSCDPCGKDVLAYASLIDGDVAHVCSLCGSTGTTTFLGRASLDDLGLTIAARPILEPKTPKKSGCAKGCSSSRAPGAAGKSEEASSCGTSCSCSKTA